MARKKVASSVNARPVDLRLRIQVIRGGLLLLFSILVVRAAQLTLHPDERLTALADRQYNSEVELAPQRGTIRDSKGVILAQSLEVDSLYIEPNRLKKQTTPAERGRIARQLGKILDLPQDKLARSLERNRGFAWLKRRILPQEAKAALDLEIPGLHSVKEQKRFYPHVELAAHLMGFAGLDMVGLEGVEKQYEKLLRSDGHRFVRPRDARGKSYAEGLFVEPNEPGKDVWLTIDSKIQYMAEIALRKGVVAARATAGYAIVQDPKTGAILALAVQPTFNPNAVSRFTADDWRNRPISDVMEPGSTMKALVMASALDLQAIRADQIFFCEDGHYNVANVTIHDTKKHGWLDPAHILQVSSNVGMIKIAAEVGSRPLASKLEAFGLGARTGIDLPGEGRGIFPRVETWGTVKLATVSFGQGIGMTGLQLTNAFSALANGGELMRPYVVDRIATDTGHVLFEQRPEVLRRVISSATATTVTQMLELVTAEGGTGTGARLDNWGVASKTGTAQKVDPVSGGYSHDKRVASFIGYTPARAPRLTILVVIDEPRTSVYGGIVAAPVFREIADGALRYLEVPADPPTAAKGAVATAEQATGEGYVTPKDPSAPSLPAGRVDIGEDGALDRVPNFAGLSIRAALRTAMPRGLVVDVEGSGVATRQLPEPGAKLPADKKIQLWFEPTLRSLTRG